MLIVAANVVKTNAAILRTTGVIRSAKTVREAKISQAKSAAVQVH
jgi:hypothetical protein